MKMFGAQPFAWVALSSCWLLFSLLAFAAFAQLGALMLLCLSPAVTSGMMHAAAAQERGEQVLLTYLLFGFQSNGANLVRLGLLLLFGVIAIAGVILLLLLFKAPDAVKSGAQFSTWAKDEVGIFEAAVVLVGALLIQGVMWFAIPLSTFHAMRPIEAIRWSAFALVANPGAMLGVIFPFAVAAGIVTVIGSTDNRVLSVFASFAQLMIVSVFNLSMYVSFRQVFKCEDADRSSQHERTAV
jgi:hypothetical protein